MPVELMPEVEKAGEKGLPFSDLGLHGLESSTAVEEADLIFRDGVGICEGVLGRARGVNAAP